MTTAIEYALMAGRAYYDTRADKNRFPIPAEWDGLKHESASSGFEVISFVPTGATMTTSTEIVISFAGTGPLGDGDWLYGNFPQALGALGEQLKQAADYYLQVKARELLGSASPIIRAAWKRTVQRNHVCCCRCAACAKQAGKAEPKARSENAS